VPQHNHIYNAASGGRGQTTTAVAGNTNCEAPALTNIYGTPNDGTLMNVGMLSPTAASQPHENMQPYQVLNFIIALTGIYPARG
jgi:microcystin-dependent protein